MSLNDFELGKILGKGSFASVLLVTRKSDRKIYAMKRINIAKMDPKEREGALNEIRILASLSHPNIIGYKEAFFDEMSKTLNIVMEYADDGDIDKKIKENLKRRNLFSEETIWTWIIQILEGLKYLHDNQIMHRDLKCANLFLMKNGLLKLGDLNVSKIAKLGIAQTQTGTPYYISPEIWNEQPYDYKCDIWSVGCIIYEMCTLRPPFRGTSLKELYKNIINGYYIPISNNYSNDIKDIISMMLVVDSKKRASAEQLLDTNIIKKWVKKIKYENYNGQLGEEIEKNYSKYSKANLIQTIKVPKNLWEINRYLPKKKYNPSEEMMKNDKYEIMKETMKKGYNKYNNKNIDLSWLIEGEIKINKNIINNNYNYMNYNKGNNNRQHTPNIGKYNYLNKYDNNMRLIKNDDENNYINGNENHNVNPRNKYNDNNPYYNKNNNYNKGNIQYNIRNEDINYRNIHGNINKNKYYNENRNWNDNIYNYKRNNESNNYQKNNHEYNYNKDKYNNNYIEHLYRNEEKNLTPNKYSYQNNERNYNNNIYYNIHSDKNRIQNKINNNPNDYNNYNYNSDRKEKYNINQLRQQNNNINNNSHKNEYKNFNKRNVNRYKYIFLEEDENEQNNSDNKYNNNYLERDKYQQNKYNNNINKIYNNEYNRGKDIGPRYNLYDFRYKDMNNINNIKNSDEFKIIYQKINYNNYCQQNNFDRKRNYHYYRENGYYNYNQAMKYHQKDNSNDYYNDGYGKYY